MQPRGGRRTHQSNDVDAPEAQRTAGQPRSPTATEEHTSSAWPGGGGAIEQKDNRAAPPRPKNPPVLHGQAAEARWKKQGQPVTR